MSTATINQLRQPEAPVRRQTLTVDEVCATLGVSRPVVYKALKDGALPARRLGKRFLIGKEAVERWLMVSA